MKTIIKVNHIDMGIITFVGIDYNDAMSKVIDYFLNDYPYNSLEIVDIQ